MKNILIALDHEATAKEIAQQGYDLAKAMNARTTLLHVISEPVYYSSNYSPIMGFDGFNIDCVQTETVDELKKRAHHFLEKSKIILGDDSIETVVSSGPFAETILDTAKRIKADIIVLGAHSRRVFEKVLVGSVTKNILNHSFIPLFIIPTNALQNSN